MLLKKRLRTLLLYAIGPSLLALLWYTSTAYGWISPQILPTPHEVWRAAVDLINDGTLFSHILVSAQRVTIGFVIGILAGCALGIAMGLNDAVDDYIRPTFTAIAQIPNIGWIPLFMLFFGVGETLKLLIIAKAAIIPMVMNTSSGIRQGAPALQEVAHILKFNRKQVLYHVQLPAAVPSMFTGFRIALTQAWTALVAVELLATSEGVGYLLVWGRQMFWMDIVVLAMIIIGIVGFAMDYVL
jgi:sulfonate transport system permease protein